MIRGCHDWTRHCPLESWIDFRSVLDYADRYYGWKSSSKIMSEGKFRNEINTMLKVQFECLKIKGLTVGQSPKKHQVTEIFSLSKLVHRYPIGDAFPLSKLL